MKKLLIIQMDEAYFLFETLLMLERNRDALKDFQLTLLVREESLKEVQDGSGPLLNGITTSLEEVQQHEYDLSCNFSLTDSCWELQGQIKAPLKVGPFIKDGQLHVPDVWSSYLLTLKGRAPFLTFHLQDIYKNILGIKRLSQTAQDKKIYQEIVFGFCNTSLFPALEQEKLINLITEKHPQLRIKDVSEVDPVSDLSHVLYIGPATLDALKICEDGATGIFLSSQFQGFNLLPHNEGHLFVSSRNSLIAAEKLMPFISAEITNSDLPENFPYAAYQIDEENLFGSYLRSLNASDDTYPVYQSHVVLWNFLLNLFDINLEIIRCTPQQIALLQHQKEVLQKTVRLYDYAMSSIDIINTEANSVSADAGKLQGHLKNLQEIEEITDKISQSNAFLRPVLDFYRIRRGQNSGGNLQEQAQHSFLTYSEEHQALKALLELFTVTLRKNEVNI